MAKAVEVREFARGYFPGDQPPRIPGADLRKNGQGYFIRLDFDGIHEDDLEHLVSKARTNFAHVEVVEQVIEGDDIAKERRYVESVADVPEGYKAERGPKGGIYYETNPLNSPSEGSGAPGDVASEVGYSGEPVLAVQFEDVDTGDRIAFEQPESGERDMGEVVAIGEDENAVEVESGDGRTLVEAAPLEGVEKSEDIELPTVCRMCETKAERTRMEGSFLCPECATESQSEAYADFDMDTDEYTLCTETEKDGDGGGGTVTSSTAGVHSARHSPADEDEEEDFGRGTMGKADPFEAEVFRVLAPEDDAEEFDDELIGIGVDFPNHDVYVDWRNESFPDELDNAHVSIYGSIDDLQQATGNVIEPIGTVDGRGGGLAKMAKAVVASVTKAEETWTYYWGPNGGEGWINTSTGEIRYQQQRPGEAPEGGDGYDDWLADGWAEPPDDASDIAEGQTIEFWESGTGEYYEGVASIVDEDGAYVRVDSFKGPNGIAGPKGDDEITAVVTDDDVQTDIDVTDDIDPTEGPVVNDYDWGDEGWRNTAQVTDWEPIHDVNDDTVHEDATAVLVADYDHAAEATAYVGKLYHDEDQDEWKIDVHNHDEPDYNFETPVNDNDVEAYVSHDDLDEGTAEADAQQLLDEIEEYEVSEDGTDGADGASADSDPEEDPADPDAAEAPANGSDTATDAVDEADTAETGHAASGLDQFDESDITETKGMGEVNATTGNSIASKQVVEFHDGTEAVYTDFDHNSASPELGQRALASAAFLRAVDGDVGVPEHAGNPDEGYMFVEAAPGYDAVEAPDDHTAEIDAGEFYEEAAWQVIAGNNDAHANNVKVDASGDLHWFDMDHSAGSIHDSSAHNKSYEYDDNWDRMFGELAKSAQALDVADPPEARQRIFEAVQEVTDGTSVEEVQQMREAAATHDDEFAQNMYENFVQILDGNYPYEP